MFGYWLTNGQLIGKAPNFTVVYTLDVIALIVWPGITWKFVPRSIRPSAVDLGLTSLKRNGADILQTSILCFVILAMATWAFGGLAWAYLWRYDWILDQGDGFSWGMMIPAGPAGLVARVYLAVSAGLVEELYFRGLLKHVLYHITSKEVSCPLFLLTSAIAFGAIHWEGGLSKLIATTLVGLVAARLFLWLRTVWPLIFAHAMVDFLFI